jgi:hypothetical protein
MLVLLLLLAMLLQLFHLRALPLLTLLVLRLALDGDGHIILNMVGVGTTLVMGGDIVSLVCFFVTGSLISLTA